MPLEVASAWSFGGWLLAFADRLFGREEPEPGPPRRWLLRFLGVTALLCAIIVARRPDAVTNPQFWAEDGYVFFYENLTVGFPNALAKMYQGFPYLTHRLIAFAGGLVPFELAPRVYTTAAIALTALGLATLALPGFRHLVRSDFLRVLFGVAVVSGPFDKEVLSTVTNLGWFLAVSLFLLSFVRLPRHPWRLALAAAGGAALVWSTPLAAVNLPIWLLRAWHGVQRRIRRELVWALVLVTTLIALSLMTGALGAQSTSDALGQGATLSATFALYLRHCLVLMSYRAITLMLPPDVTASVAAAGIPAIAGLTALLVLSLLGVSALGRFRSLPSILVAVYGFVAFFVIFVFGRPGAIWIGALGALPYRYMIFPTAMLALALVALLDGLASRARLVTATGMTAVLCWAWSSRFIVPPFTDYDWPRWAARLERKLASGSRAPLIIPANPPFAPLKFDPVDIGKEVDVPATTILAGLGTHGTFRQGFVARCAPLTVVEMRLAAQAPSSQGALRMTLLDATGRGIARAEMSRADLGLDGWWEGFVFDPIAESEGKRYTIVLQAVDNLAEATVFVLGARGDPYPDGAATWGGTAVDGDASFGTAAPEPLANDERGYEMVPQASGFRRR